MARTSLTGWRRRRAGGRLSGRSVATTTSQTAAYAVSSQKTERQPK